MDFQKLFQSSVKPVLYEPGDAKMWTDPYISQQLLKIHLDPNIDAASRKPESIKRTLEFIYNFCNKSGIHILDLGCGPGIYTKEIAARGHEVTGMDFSENSIAYAKKQASINNQNIEYICQNYLELDYVEKFDLITMIYADFGVLIPVERERLLQNIFTALKPGGMFIFDVLNDKNLEIKFPDHKSWNVSLGGFWRELPYLELINGFHYEAEHVYLKQHTIIDQAEICTKYRFWTHYFNSTAIITMISDYGFENIDLYDNVLPESDIWNGDNVTFCKTNKPE